MLCREQSCQLEILGKLVKENHWLPNKLVVRWSRKYVGGEKKVVRMGKISALTVRTAAAEYYCHLVFKKKIANNSKAAFYSLLLLLHLCSAQSQDSQVAQDSPVLAAAVGEGVTTHSGLSFRLDNKVSHNQNHLIK